MSDDNHSPGISLEIYNKLRNQLEMVTMSNTHLASELKKARQDKESGVEDSTSSTHSNSRAKTIEELSKELFEARNIIRRLKIERDLLLKALEKHQSAANFSSDEEDNYAWQNKLDRLKRKRAMIESPETPTSTLASIPTETTPTLHTFQNDATLSSKSTTKKRQRRPNQVKVGPRKVVIPQGCDLGPDGYPTLPLALGVLTVVSLGTVVWDREGFHTEKYIWPVGYKTRRTYFSMIDASSSTVYTSEILDDGDSPLFRVTAEDNPDDPITASSSTACWSRVMKEAHAVRNQPHSASASGPEFFGLSYPLVAWMIQGLDSVDKLEKYTPQEFEISTNSGRKKGRAAKDKTETGDSNEVVTAEGSVDEEANGDGTEVEDEGGSNLNSVYIETDADERIL